MTGRGGLKGGHEGGGDLGGVEGLVLLVWDFLSLGLGLAILRDFNADLGLRGPVYVDGSFTDYGSWPVGLC